MPGYTDLSHLSEEAINVLYNRYMGDETVVSLMAELNINAKPSNFIKLFPLVPTPSLCPHCNASMHLRRPSKSAIKSEFYRAELFCSSCAHQEIPMFNGLRLCNCEGCVTNRQELANSFATTKRDEILKVHKMREPLLIQKMDLRRLVFLVATILARAPEKYDNILPLVNSEYTIPVMPTEDGSSSCLADLYKLGAIAVDAEKSEIEAFVVDDINQFYATRVHWLPNIALENGERATMNEAWSGLMKMLSVWNLNWNESVLGLWQEIALDECLQYLSLQIDQYNLEFSAEQKTRTVLKELLCQYSVAQIYGFIYYAVKDAAAFYQSRNSNGRRHASNTIPGKIKGRADLCTANLWEARPFHRDNRAPRSTISQYFFDSLLRLEDDAGFMHPPVAYWNGVLKGRLHASEDQEAEIVCPDCSSAGISLRFAGSNKEIMLRCGDCGHEHLYQRIAPKAGDVS